MTCPHAPSKWVGIVTNDPTGFKSAAGAHVAEAVCARQDCIESTLASTTRRARQSTRLYTYEELRKL